MVWIHWLLKWVTCHCESIQSSSVWSHPSLPSLWWCGLIQDVSENPQPYSTWRQSSVMRKIRIKIIPLVFISVQIKLLYSTPLSIRNFGNVFWKNVVHLSSTAPEIQYVELNRFCWRSLKPFWWLTITSDLTNPRYSLLSVKQSNRFWFFKVSVIRTLQRSSPWWTFVCGNDDGNIGLKTVH